MKYDLMILDLDGVLIDSIDVMRQAFAAAYAATVGSGEPPFTEYRKYLGWNFPDILRAMGLPLAMHPIFVQESIRLAPLVRIYNGIPEMLDGLASAGTRMGVATGKDGKRARALLQQVGLARYLDLVIGGDEVAKAKPSPEVALLHLSHFGTKRERTLFVGDAVADMRCGQAAGIPVAAVMWGEGEPAALLAEQPDFVVHKPADLMALNLEPVDA